MTQCASEFDAYAFSKQPGYDERVVRREFAKAVPLRTVVVYCYDPRAVGIPAAVAKEFGDVFPGAIVRDDARKKVASTTTLFEVVVAGGRAIDALRSVRSRSTCLGSSASSSCITRTAGRRRSPPTASSRLTHASREQTSAPSILATASASRTT